MSRSSKIKYSVMSRIAKLAEFPSECSSSVPVIELKGNREAFIHGCSKIIDYTENVVVLKAKRLLVRIEGSCLILSDFTSCCVCVDGTIDSVSFLSEDK